MTPFAILTCLICAPWTKQYQLICHFVPSSSSLSYCGAADFCPNHINYPQSKNMTKISHEQWKHPLCLLVSLSLMTWSILFRIYGNETLLCEHNSKSKTIKYFSNCIITVKIVTYLLISSCFTFCICSPPLFPCIYEHSCIYEHRFSECSWGVIQLKA